MSMTLAIVGSVAIGFGVLMYKSWLALHRMAGITPKTLKYTHDERKLPVTSGQQTGDNLVVPEAMARQLSRIHHKAQSYFAEFDVSDKTLDTTASTNLNTAQLVLNHPTRHVSEGEFIAYKMTYERLPQMLADYQQVMRFGIQNLSHQGEYHHEHNGSAQAKHQAMHLLAEFLDNLETRLDDLNHNAQYQHLQALEEMARYVRNRD